MTPEEAIDVRQFLESRNRHLADGLDGVNHFDYWARDRAALDPRFVSNLAEASRDILIRGNTQLTRAALQSLAAVGAPDDCQLLGGYASSAIPAVADDARVCMKFLQWRFRTLAQLRSEVIDQESFAAFARALIDDRERSEPQRDGELEGRKDRPQEQWQCNCISDYLAGALSYFTGGGQRWAQLTWQDLAAFFDSGRTSDHHIAPGSLSDAALVRDVTDYDSFVGFVDALIEERRRAESIETMQRDKPAWAVEAAEGWQNSRISDFLAHAMLYFEVSEEVIPAPTWADLADSLFRGKVDE